MPKGKAVFITGTDTGVGKTVVTLCLGLILKAKGHDVGIMKPVQCAGEDAQFLKRSLGLSDDMRLINPFYAPEPLSPHLAFRRAKVKFDKKRVLDSLKELRLRHDIVLVEGAGGLMVPLTDSYNNADLAVDLKAGLIIVARLGLGTINHTLLTVSEAKRRGLKILGIIFCQARSAKKGLPERSNPEEIERLSKVKVLGTIPYLKHLNRRTILRRCKKINLND